MRCKQVMPLADWQGMLPDRLVGRLQTLAAEAAVPAVRHTYFRKKSRETLLDRDSICS